MHLKSITVKGFKSFPDRTRLEFAPGVSVVVGPNGSGKSNITDAVLWAMGEQSPLAVRGQSMQDVIFGGGKGVQGRSAAEVEIVLDNSDQTVDLPVSELSMLRRLDRNGEGEYRINGARCRLVDVLEVLSDTGLGRESHSVISQGRVEAIVTSKPRDRRLLIEEAAGLGKHRKRRRRAQLKLERTQENLDRALDVEREARARLRPLKRQAEAADLHQRLERQTLEARWDLARDALRARQAELSEAEWAAGGARAEREKVEQALGEMAARREHAERELAQRSEQRERLAARAFGARAALSALELRLEQVRSSGRALSERVERRSAERARLREHGDGDGPAPAGRLAELEAQLAELEAQREHELERETADLRTRERDAAARAHVLSGEATAAASERERCEREASAAREAVGAAERRWGHARREAAALAAELAGANQFLRAHVAAGHAQALSAQLEVQAGCELAVAAVLDGRLDAALVGDWDAAAEVLDRGGSDGARVLMADAPGPADAGASPAADLDPPPTADARALIDLVSGPEPALGVARRLLGGAWLVERLEDVAPHFRGTAVTPAGRAWLAAAGELRQLPEGGAERVLAERNRRAELLAAHERAAGAEHAAEREREHGVEASRQAELALDAADRALRQADRARAEAEEEARRAAWLIEQRRSAPAEGAGAVRRAELRGRLEGERRAVKRAARERQARADRVAALEHLVTEDQVLVARAQALAGTLERALAGARQRAQGLDADLDADRRAGEDVAARLRTCAGEETQLQGTLRERGEEVTTAEVAAQQARDHAHEVGGELDELAQALGLEAEPAAEELDPEQEQALRERIARLARRREALGPVNPLAQDDYTAAVEHVAELETQRADLDTALRELRNLIRDTDRQIRETFEQTFAAAAANFEELVAEVFPGGRGRLRLVREDAGPRPVLGGQAAGDSGAQPASGQEGADAEAAAEAEATEQGPGADPDELLGVEIEVTPAGKSMKRLSLLSGGEKSMTAIAFLFSIFLARPCPFYILDEVEAALDDLNLDRFLGLLRRYSDRAQFIVVTHQKRTMEAADCLYGVSMGDDGVSKVVSRRLPREGAAPALASAGAA
ncbi:MAG: hypothetical protein E6G56_10240 [Actinobacteria bacterium]|nr:MAG: hypothetical protein E6G56_10240 [Actinomycetota bacterium]